MSRPAAVAAVLAVAMVVGVGAWWRAPVSATRCPDGGVLRLTPDGVATCGPGAELPAGQALTARQRFDCNGATADELALVPGIGPALAAELVAARDAGFTSWAEVDAVPGVGPARLEALQAACELRPAVVAPRGFEQRLMDAGVW